MGKQQIVNALKKLREAALELSNAVDENEFNLSSAPDYLQDTDDFAYEISSFVDDELETLEEEELNVPA